MREETPAQRLIRCRQFWPEAQQEDLIAIYPMGSRNDCLTYWRAGGRVNTGMKTPTLPCFEGSLEEFGAAIVKTYRERVDNAISDWDRQRYQKLQREYEAAYAFFKALAVPAEEEAAG